MAVERATGLPDSILTMIDLADCLGRFHSLVAPLEAQLAAFPEFAAIGIDIGGSCRSQLLQADLAALGRAPPRPVSLPPLPTFPVALGALYVLEGSGLGGKVILRALARRFGASLAAATSYFGAGGRPWAEFKSRLDAFGQADPASIPDVIGGAIQTFEQYALALSDPRLPSIYRRDVLRVAKPAR